MVRASGRSSSRRGAGRPCGESRGRRETPTGEAAYRPGGPVRTAPPRVRRWSPTCSRARRTRPGWGRFRRVVRVGRTLRRRRATPTLTPTAQPIQLTGEFVKKITNSSRARSFSVFRSPGERPPPSLPAKRSGARASATAVRSPPPAPPSGHGCLLPRGGCRRGPRRRARHRRHCGARRSVGARRRCRARRSDEPCGGAGVGR